MALTRINNQALTNVTSAGLPTLASSNMPSGTVLQVQRTYNGNASYITTTSTSKTASGITVSITPKFSNSVILIDYIGSMADHYNGSSLDATMYIKVGTGSFAAMAGLADYQIGYNSSDNRYSPFVLNGKYTATSTDTITFEVYFKSNNGGEVRLAHAGSSYGLTATEVKA